MSQIATKRKKKYGRCLYANKHIKAETIIEISELIIFPKDETKRVEKTTLGAYVYDYKGGVALALGVGSLFNHSTEPNVDYFFFNDKLYFRTNRLIRKGEQLFIDYGYDPTAK